MARTVPVEIKLPKALVAALSKIDHLHTALEDARDGIAEMLTYIDDYYINKWKLGEYLDRADAALGFGGEGAVTETDDT